MATLLTSQPIQQARSINDALPQLCGLVLAGGDGRRLRSYISRLRGDGLPKQYVKFTGALSMLEHTYHRAEKLIDRERLFTIVSQKHLDYLEVKAQLRGRSPGTVIVQPLNRETGPGLLLPLMYVQKRYPGAVVAVLPSDQFVLEEDRLMRHVRLAYAAVCQQPAKLILLGVAPDYEESDYGYIVPAIKCDTNGWGTYEVQGFVEKPDIERARDLIGRGALWNTMLMVFSVGALFRWIEELHPDMYRHFTRIYDAIGTPAEAAVIRATYDQLRTVNFSKELLEPIVHQCPGTLSVLPVTHVTWSDWGSESRIISSLSKIGRTPCAAMRGPAAEKPRRRNSKLRDLGLPNALMSR